MKNDPRVETIFHASREHEPGPERQAYLDGACGTDSGLREQVEVLLSAHDQAADFLEKPAVEGTQEGPGTSIGGYKLLQEIGEGGMGVVYMAEQTKPVRRMVALKVIKLGMDTKQVIARFEAERQALALMDHPHIARVLDAGSTEAGRPYFVMELVRGVPIHEYCDTHKLPTEERLKLFVEVCRAVQHAHQKGIIHRDLKPSNVLVTSHDGTPIPKIIDFGVAKATNQRLAERTLFTEYHQIIGTPEYMSPEQAEMSGLDVDTRSDIYALGVLLYQLLTGTTPVDPTELRTAGFEEMTRMIRDDEPPAPSTRISKLGADGEQIARVRGSDAGSLSRHFRGDLDWIVMKALEKDRTRRYETASAFAEDVMRHLGNLPVQAGPPGTAYRLRKFVHRNRRAVAVAALLLVVLGLGLVGTVAGFVKARDEARRSGEVSSTLQDVLAMTDPARSSDSGEELQEVLASVREVFGADHATLAAVLDTLGEQLYDAGEFAAAEPLYREALEVWRRAYGEDHFNVGITLGRLGQLQRAQGNDEEALETLRAALDIFAGASDAPGLAGYDARLELAALLSDRGEYDEAEALLREALAVLGASPAPRPFPTLQTLELLLSVQMSRAPDGAQDTLRRVYEETHGFYPETSPLLAVSALGYGNWLAQRGRLDEAEPFLREAIERFRSYDELPRIYFLAAADKLFQVVRRRTDPEGVREADELLRETIDAARFVWRAEELRRNLEYYAHRMLERGRYEEAVRAMLEAHAAFVEEGRSVHERDEVRADLGTVAFALTTRSDLDVEAYERALEAANIALAEAPDDPSYQLVLAAALFRLGEVEEAAETLALLPDPFTDASGRIASRMSFADHAFRALIRAQLGDVEGARQSRDALLAATRGNENGRNSRTMLEEIEAAIEAVAASTDTAGGF